MSSQTQTVTDVTTNTTTQPPRMWNVVFYNDNKTYYEFVIMVLMHLFNKTYDQAVQTADTIHESGKGVVATYTYEIATSKKDETVSLARANGHPLKVEVEPEVQP